MEKNTIEDVSFAVRPFFATLLYCIFVNENSGNMQLVKIQVNSKEELQWSSMPIPTLDFPLHF